MAADPGARCKMRVHLLAGALGVRGLPGEQNQFAVETPTGFRGRRDRHFDIEVPRLKSKASRIYRLDVFGASDHGDLMAGPGQQRAVITADRACAIDGNVQWPVRGHGQTGSASSLEIAAIWAALGFSAGMSSSAALAFS